MPPILAEPRHRGQFPLDRSILEQQRIEAILFSIGDGILMTGNDGKIQLANRRAVEILNKPGTSLEGQGLCSVLPENTELKTAVMQVVASPFEQAVREVDLSTAERRLVLHISARPVICPASKTVLGVVVAMHDVTLEKELDTMKQEFLHSITHDLRNPVGAILGFLHFLRKGAAGVLNAEQGSMIASIHKSASQLMAMINNILDIARMEAGKTEVDLKTASLAGLASHAMEVLGSLARGRGIAMELVAEEEFSVEMDPNQIERVLANLIGNAIKFSPDDGKVTIRITDLKDRLLLCVEDDGPGIPAAYREKVFGKFEQVPGQRRGGTGLGLTISKRFVEAHRGRIWVESAPGKGAQFCFTLPKNLIKNKKGEIVILPALEAVSAS